MHEDTREIAQHMREFGCYTLGGAVSLAVFNEMMRPNAHALAVVQAAHATEIIIKARIAQEHPLLIFETLPKSTKSSDLLTIEALFEDGKTIQYFDLPERLWATTGYRIKDVDRFKDFGKLRNKIMHFAIPDYNLSDEVLKFIIEVIDPLLQDFWDDTVAKYTEAYDDVIVMEGYLQAALERVEIEALTSNTQKFLVENGPPEQPDQD